MASCVSVKLVHAVHLLVDVTGLLGLCGLWWIPQYPPLAQVATRPTFSTRRPEHCLGIAIAKVQCKVQRGVPAVGLAIDTWSLPAARCNAVAPTLLLAFTPMKSSLLMSTWKASTCPSAAAKSSAFRCISSEKFTAAASACRTSRAASRLSRPSRASSNCCPSGLQCSGRAEGTGAGRALAALAPTCASRASGALALGSSSSSGRLPNSWAS
mmetsp:Transcript_53498/g.165597  ORF Transcript_53498/g.165597 Transcript_53498/m.165597 type:complete len:212 (+) Transcript_53498:152-787(+)